MGSFSLLKSGINWIIRLAFQMSTFMPKTKMIHQVSLPNSFSISSEFKQINFFSPWYDQKTYSESEKKLIHLNWLNIRRKNLVTIPRSL